MRRVPRTSSIRVTRNEVRGTRRSVLAIRGSLDVILCDARYDAKSSRDLG